MVFTMLDTLVNTLDRRRVTDAEHHGLTISIVSWVMLAVTILSLLARMTMKTVFAQRGNRFGWDDAFILLAALCSIGQTVAVLIEAAHALGQHSSALSVDSLMIFQKAEYVACILYIANMGCARISLCILIKQILPGSAARYSALIFAGLTSIWTVSGVLATAFPCSLPNPWQFSEDKKCFNVITFVNYVGITNIAIEVLLVLIPLLVWNLRLTAGRRVSVSLAFVARLSIVVAVSVQLSFFNQYSGSYDWTFDYWRNILCIQVAQNLSVATACLPYLHPFIVSILAGRTQPNSLVFEYSTKGQFEKYFCSKSGSTGSQSSTESSKGTTDPEYCRPLATWGLDRSSAHLHSQHFNRFPSHIVAPIAGPAAPENVFNRSVNIESLQRSNSSKKSSPIPKTLSEVGVLPLTDWDADESNRDSVGSSASRRPASDYVFNREKVISVSENHDMYPEDYWNKYPPPPTNPKYPKKM